MAATTCGCHVMIQNKEPPACAMRIDESHRSACLLAERLRFRPILPHRQSQSDIESRAPVSDELADCRTQAGGVTSPGFTDGLRLRKGRAGAAEDEDVTKRQFSVSQRHVWCNRLAIRSGECL